MRLPKVVLAALIGFVLGAAQTQAQAAQPATVLQVPELKPGTVYQYQRKDLWKNEIVSTRDEIVVSVDRGQAKLNWSEKPSSKGGVAILDLAHQRFLGQSAPASKAYPAVRFPLAVGDTWDWKTTMQWSGDRSVTIAWDVSAKFVGWEDVTVPAGTFRAVKIEHRGRWEAVGHNSSDTFEMDFWYAPDVGRIIKGREVHYQNRRVDTQTEDQLTKFQPAQEDAGRLQWKEKLEAAIKAKDWELLDKLTEEYALEIEREKLKK